MWCSLFNPKDQDFLPIIKIDIILNEEDSTISQIEFQPSIPEFIDVLRYVVDKIAHSINGPNRQLADLAEYYFQEPKQLLQTYEEKYNYLIDGQAQADVEKFNLENHTFDEYTRVNKRIKFVHFIR
jgi:hypothetical protein